MTPSELWNDNMKIKEKLTQRHQYSVKNVSVDLTIKKNAFSENKNIYFFYTSATAAAFIKFLAFPMQRLF